VYYPVLIAYTYHFQSQATVKECTTDSILRNIHTSCLEEVLPNLIKIQIRCPINQGLDKLDNTPCVRAKYFSKSLTATSRDERIRGRPSEILGLMGVPYSSLFFIHRDIAEWLKPVYSFICKMVNPRTRCMFTSSFFTSGGIKRRLPGMMIGGRRMHTRMQGVSEVLTSQLRQTASIRSEI
jgi:hypothetical protein